jgi:hypothetical protein
VNLEELIQRLINSGPFLTEEQALAVEAVIQLCEDREYKFRLARTALLNITAQTGPLDGHGPEYLIASRALKDLGVSHG